MLAFVIVMLLIGAGLCWWSAARLAEGGES